MKVTKVSILQTKSWQLLCINHWATVQYDSLCFSGISVHWSSQPSLLHFSLQARQSWLPRVLSSCWCSADQRKPERFQTVTATRNSQGRSKRSKVLDDSQWGFSAHQEMWPLITTLSSAVWGVGGMNLNMHEQMVVSEGWTTTALAWYPSVFHSMAKVLSLTSSPEDTSGRIAWHHFWHAPVSVIPNSSLSCPSVSGRLHATFLLFARQRNISTE